MDALSGLPFDINTLIPYEEFNWDAVQGLDDIAKDITKVEARVAKYLVDQLYQVYSRVLTTDTRIATQLSEMLQHPIQSLDQIDHRILQGLTANLCKLSDIYGDGTIAPSYYLVERQINPSTYDLFLEEWCGRPNADLAIGPFIDGCFAAKVYGDLIADRGPSVVGLDRDALVNEINRRYRLFVAEQEQKGIFEDRNRAKVEMCYIPLTQRANQIANYVQSSMVQTTVNVGDGQVVTEDVIPPAQTQDVEISVVESDVIIDPTVLTAPQIIPLNHGYQAHPMTDDTLAFEIQEGSPQMPFPAVVQGHYQFTDCGRFNSHRWLYTWVPDPDLSRSVQFWYNEDRNWLYAGASDGSIPDEFTPLREQCGNVCQFNELGGYIQHGCFPPTQPVSSPTQPVPIGVTPNVPSAGTTPNPANPIESKPRDVVSSAPVSSVPDKPIDVGDCCDRIVNAINNIRVGNVIVGGNPTPKTLAQTDCADMNDEAYAISECAVNHYQEFINREDVDIPEPPAEVTVGDYIDLLRKQASEVPVDNPESNNGVIP